MHARSINQIDKNQGYHRYDVERKKGLINLFFVSMSGQNVPDIPNIEQEMLFKVFENHINDCIAFPL